MERANPEERPRKLYRSRSNRVLSGVAGGMGEYFNLDPTIIRVLWVIFAVTSLGAAVLLYIILILVVPEEPLY
ncbi:MAG: PspC domain-containing protein [Candidatus Zixiibacteriota bacterium]|nr:MAG: PspC domain-containing protein [candidate division Zixibacteria bacterium]